jgi:TonB family protein
LIGVFEHSFARRGAGLERALKSAALAADIRRWNRTSARHERAMASLVSAVLPSNRHITHMSVRFLRLSAVSCAALGALTLGTAASAADFKWVQDAKSCEAPAYPHDSAAKGEQGTTTLRILVGVDGKAIDSEIETSSKYRKLDTAAQRALMECTFKPVPADAKPQQQWVQTQYVWKLN